MKTPKTPVLASKLLTRGLLVTVIVFASLGALAALVYGSLAQTALSLGVTTIELSVMGPEGFAPELPLPPDASAQYASVWVDVPAGETPAAPLISIATLLPYIAGGLACLVILGLAVQLLRGRQFGLASAISMFVLAFVAIGTGFAVPALEAHAQTLFVEHLGLPTSGDAASIWVSPDTPLWEYSDWPIILLGLVTALGGWLVLRARALRLDLEGTI